jgi:nickel-type superoxide dismutase maturation protease
MMPTLRPGDRLLVDRRAYRDRPPRVGEIVVLVDPEERRRWLVKRVAKVDPSGASVEVLGDAADTARDSRRFGAVPFGSVVGRVVRCYFPSDRRREF